MAVAKDARLQRSRVVAALGADGVQLAALLHQENFARVLGHLERLHPASRTRKYSIRI